SQIRSTNPLERLNREIKRRTNVASIFPNEAAIVRLVGAILLEQNDEWAVTRRYMSLETMVGLCNDPAVGQKAIPAAWQSEPLRRGSMLVELHHLQGHNPPRSPASPRQSTGRSDHRVRWCALAAPPLAAR